MKYFLKAIAEKVVVFVTILNSVTNQKQQLKLISFKNNPKSPSDTQNVYDSDPIFQANTHQDMGKNRANFVCQMAALGYS